MKGFPVAELVKGGAFERSGSEADAAVAKANLNGLKVRLKWREAE